MRTHGQTQNCGGCRFWSEMVARCHGGGPTEAMCLADSGPQSGKYTTERMTCESWKSGHLGAVDDPPNYGEQVRAAYAAEEARLLVLKSSTRLRQAHEIETLKDTVAHLLNVLQVCREQEAELKAKIAQLADELVATYPVTAEVETMRTLIRHGVQGWDQTDMSVAEELVQKWAAQESEAPHA